MNDNQNEKLVQLDSIIHSLGQLFSDPIIKNILGVASNLCNELIDGPNEAAASKTRRESSATYEFENWRHPTFDYSKVNPEEIKQVLTELYLTDTFISNTLGLLEHIKPKALNKYEAKFNSDTFEALKRLCNKQSDLLLFLPNATGCDNFLEEKKPMLSPFEIPQGRMGLTHRNIA